MPHVLLILVDALRADHLGCYAGSDRGTPNLDALARDGVMFTNAISQASWTRPSTASVMTGLYPSQNGLGGRWNKTKAAVTAGALDPSIPTIAELVGAAGHATAFIGGNANLKPLFGITRGFMHNGWRPTNDGAVLAEDFASWLAATQPLSSFCYIHLMDVHNPLPSETIPSRLDSGLDLDLVKESRGELLSYYASAVQRADRHVGRIVQTLRDTDLLEDTLIMVSADHGEELGEHGGMLSHGRSLYRELVQVPLIVRLPQRAFAGSVIKQPVELIDVMPTTLDFLQCPPVDVPGSSLLPVMSGSVLARRGYAFSEFLKPDRYGQTVVTETHQYIQSYLLEATQRSSPKDLLPGLSVEIKGQPIQGGRFMATKILRKPDDQPTLGGPIEQLDTAQGLVTVMGITCQVDHTTKLLGKASVPLTLSQLAEGDRITIGFRVQPETLPIATYIKRKAPGGKAKIEGVIEHAQELEDGVFSITVLGMNILIDQNVKVRALKNKERKSIAKSAVQRVLEGDFIEMQRELYDFTADPAEARNIADARPDIAQELEEVLEGWTQTLLDRAHVPTSSVDVDPETMDQLRLMGYVE